jgi:Toxin SymE, type I toxin-antitoxin system
MTLTILCTNLRADGPTPDQSRAEHAGLECLKSSHESSIPSTAQSGGNGRRALRPRILKIEEDGDFYASKVRPRIRLSGRWLERAGFRPGHRVQVDWIEDGVLALHFIEVNQSAK